MFVGCEVGSCADMDAAIDSTLPMRAVFLLPQSTNTRQWARDEPKWKYKAVCAMHADGWWDGDVPPNGLEHYALTEVPVVNHSPVRKVDA